MKLIFFLQRSQWFISHAENWSALTSQEDINLALSVLPLECVDEYEIDEQPVQQGTVTLSQINEDSVKLSFLNNDGTLADELELALDYQCLVSVDWQDPPHKDNWINSAVQLKLENVRRLSLTLYIPQREDSDGKNLLIRNNASGEEKVVYLQRGQKNECVVVDASEASNHHITFRCDAEAANDSFDARRLGFVLLDKTVEV